MDAGCPLCAGVSPTVRAVAATGATADDAELVLASTVAGAGAGASLRARRTPAYCLDQSVSV